VETHGFFEHLGDSPSDGSLAIPGGCMDPHDRLSRGFITIPIHNPSHNGLASSKMAQWGWKSLIGIVHRSRGRMIIKNLEG
jgi:hypothetical protein